MHALLKAHGALELLSHPHIEAATRADMEGSREDVQAQVFLAHGIAAERESRHCPSAHIIRCRRARRDALDR